jgi:lipopolysaccharide heptosyltransferase II
MLPGWPAVLALPRHPRCCIGPSNGGRVSVNFEGDLRSHLLPWLAGSRRRVGFAMAGGGPLLTDIVSHDPTRHTTRNALALVERAFDLPSESLPGPDVPEATADWRLRVPDEARRGAAATLVALPAARPLIALHPGGGRPVKQWHPDRFAAAAGTVAREHGAAVLLTGSDDDRPVTDAVAARLGESGIPLLRAPASLDLVVLAGILERCRLLITGDTGPMHLAAAVGTPVVAVFGPSMPWRYAPLPTAHRIVRVDLPCSPCNRIRRPPERCRGHVPDCLDGVAVEPVIAAARHLLGEAGHAGDGNR